MKKFGVFKVRLVVGLTTIVVLIYLAHVARVHSGSLAAIQSFFLRRYRSSKLPWYTTTHRPLTAIQDNFSTTHLTTSERAQLEVDGVSLAARMARAAFGSNYATAIPGTRGLAETTQAIMAARSTIDCWTRGEWVRDELPEPIRHLQDPLYGSCDAKFYRDHAKSEWRPAVQYRWKPTCAFHAESIDPAKWCQLLRGRNMLLVGDLVQYQVHDLLLDAFRDDTSVCYGELGCKMHTLCDAPKEASLRYLRNDVLSSLDSLDVNGSMISMPFLVGPVMRDYQIFILNRATVAEDDETFVRQLIDMLSALRQMNPGALIIYRSSFAGHPFCDEAQEPLHKHLSDSELRMLPYGWSEIRRRNAMARSIVEAAGGVFVDLGSVVELRPDGHVGGTDCLRYCMPGPLDAWANILYNAMLHLEGESF